MTVRLNEADTAIVESQIGTCANVVPMEGCLHGDKAR